MQGVPILQLQQFLTEALDIRHTNRYDTHTHMCCESFFYSSSLLIATYSALEDMFSFKKRQLNGDMILKGVM